ncbi:autotransporter domain-containing protein [Proteus sp. NMG38-2]|nr:autotransporter domain-containing protein [Proteus sp. NMG38-2]
MEIPSYDIRKINVFDESFLPSELFISTDGGKTQNKINKESDKQLDTIYLERISEDGIIVVGYATKSKSILDKIIKEENFSVVNNNCRGQSECYAFSYNTMNNTFTILEKNIKIKHLTKDGNFILYNPINNENEKFIYDINKKESLLLSVDNINNYLPDHPEKNILLLSITEYPFFSGIKRRNIDIQKISDNGRVFIGQLNRDISKKQLNDGKYPRTAFVTTNDGPIREINRSEFGSSKLTDISTDGNYSVGWEEVWHDDYDIKLPTHVKVSSSLFSQAILYDLSQDSLINIGNLSQKPNENRFRNAKANDISADGKYIVGWSETDNYNNDTIPDNAKLKPVPAFIMFHRHGFVYFNNTMHDLGTLSNGKDSEAHAITDDGRIIYGLSTDEYNNWRQVIWINAQLSDKSFNAEKQQIADKKNNLIDKTNAERERLAKEQADKANAERERLAKEQADKANAERERLAKEQADKAKAERERLAKEQADKANAERERLAKEQADKANTERERLAKEQADKANAERERLAKEQADKVKAERERLAKEQADKAKAERERLAKEQADKANAERERLAKEQADKANAERERLAKEQADKAKAEQERLAKEQADKANAERERLAKEHADKANAERERLAKEQADKANAERERLAKEQADKIKAEQERLAKEQADKAKAERERLAKEQADKAQAEKERLAEITKQQEAQAEKEKTKPSIVISKPIDIENTYKSMQLMAENGYKFMDMQQGQLRYLASATCSVGTEKACISGFAHHQRVSKANATQTGISTAYRFDINHIPLVVGLAIDTDISSSLPKGYQYQSYALPLIGFSLDLIPSLNAELNNNALHLSLKGAYLNRKVSIERQALADTESGKGNTKISGYHIDLQGSYPYAISNEFMLTPFVGLTFNQISRSAYSETQNAQFAAHYDALKTHSLLAKIGLGMDHLLGSSFILNTKAGLLWNLSHYQGDFRSHIDYLGQQKIDYLENKKQLKQRPFVHIGLMYQVDKHSSIGTKANWEMTTYRNHDMQFGIDYTYRF